MPFSKGGPAGAATAVAGAKPKRRAALDVPTLRTPSESATASFDGRRLSKVLLRYSWQE